jgi:hypothetical protein
MMTALAQTGASLQEIECFLGADPDGRGALRDRIAADMANQLLAAFGQTTRQSPADVKRIRQRGAWVGLGERPRE